MKTYYLSRQKRDPSTEFIIDPKNNKESRRDYHDYLSKIGLIDDEKTACPSRPDRSATDIEGRVWDLGAREVNILATGDSTYELTDRKVLGIQNLYILLNLVIGLYDLVQRTDPAMWDDVSKLDSVFRDNNFYSNIEENLGDYVDSTLNLQCWMKPILQSGGLLLAGLAKINRENLHSRLEKLREIRFEMAEQLHAIIQSDGYSSGLSDVNVNKIGSPYYLQSIM